MSYISPPISDLWYLSPPLSEYQWKQLFPSSMWDFQWMRGQTPLSHWQMLIFVWLGYIISLVVLQRFMATRAAFQLKLVTIIHNLFLSAWSLVMFLGIAYGTVVLIGEGGLWSAFCLSHSSKAYGPLFYWLYIYYLSKYYELFDTVLLVLKKKPLQFLHVYHHIIVVAMVWSWLDQSVSISCTAAAANTFIHVIMYLYYAQTASGQQPWYKKYITQMQLVQFGISFLLTLPVFLDLRIGEAGGRTTIVSSCTGVEALFFTMLANTSFLVLFSNFYSATYKEKKS